MKTYTLAWNGRRLELGTRTRIMGIVNVTPDSFSDGGRFYDPDAAVAQGERMAEAGADMIDIGGESTRPYSDPVSEEEEARRVLPVIERLAARISLPISIDTTKSGIAERALEAGADIINDVSALRVDPLLAQVAARAGVPLILMHMKGTPKEMQKNPRYDDLIGEIKSFLAEAVHRAEAAGVSRSNIIVDPGIGFGKTFAHNLQVLNRLEAFAELDLPLLVGSSRKAFIRNLLKSKDQTDLDPESPLVAKGTQATVAAAVLKGAHIVRVHDVEDTRITVRIIDAVRRAGNA
ncbi:MAG: dihydropteroate synthase [Thermodesulfobacteriota bacterium]